MAVSARSTSAIFLLRGFIATVAACFLLPAWTIALAAGAIAIAMLELVAESEGRLLDDIRHLNDQMMHLDQRIRELDEAQVEHPRHLTSESLDVLYVIAQATLFGPVGVVTLDELVNVVKKSTQFVRARTKELEAEGLVETRSQRPLKFIVSAAGREVLEMDE